MTLPLFASLAGYRRSWLRGDLVAGLTVWAVLVPEALAYASIAGVSPVVGLSAAAVAQFATQGGGEFVALTATLAITTGLVAVVAGLLRLGFLASFISEPVLKGFIIGLALTIVAGQLPALFGVDKGEGDFFQKLWDPLTSLGDTSGLTLLVGLVSLALVLGLRRYAPAVPGSLVAVLFGIAAVAVFSLDEHGVAIVGRIDRGLPSIGLPDAPAAGYLELVSGGVGIMLVGFAEGLGAARTYAARHHYEVDADRELLGLGAANLGAGLCSGMVVNGSLSKAAGTRQLRRLYGVAARPDFLAALAALAGVLVFDTLPGLFIGIGVSLLLLLYRASRPHVAVLGEVPGARGQYVDAARHPQIRREPGVVVLRVEGGLFFANADAVRDAIRGHAAEPGTRAIVLDAETVPFVDVSAARMLGLLAADLQRQRIQLLFARDVGQVRDVLAREEVQRTLVRTYPTVRDAVDAVRQAPSGPGVPAPPP